MLLSKNADYRLRGADTLFRLLPPVSVYRFIEELSESKSSTGFSLLQTVRCTKKVGQVSILSITY